MSIRATMPRMAGHAEDVAKALNDLKGFKFGAVYIWGSAPVRPDDDAYELSSAAAQGDRVELVVFSSASNSELTISLDAPGKVKATPEEVRVTSASEVRFGQGSAFKLEGDQFRVFRDGAPGDSFAIAGKSALRLTIAVSELWARDRPAPRPSWA